MNEVSNGPAGNQEYVELVVVSNAVTYTCTNTTPPCIDIRGWIFDDNSGLHGGTSGTGVAPGAVRFANNPIWACVPLGTIILIYNNGDRNTAIPPDDLSMADGNCTIIAPLNSTLFESNNTTPGAVACSYPAAGWTAGGNWNNTILANTGDCARIVDLAGCEVFSVCYGNANTNNLIYYAGSGGQKVFYFNNGNPALQANWSSGSASPSPGNQTPGAPNNAANAAYIAQFNNGCAPITSLSVTAVSVNAGCTCNGSATANASGSIAGYTYVWYDASMNPIGQTSGTATALCAGVYNVIATSHIGCTATTSVTITSSSTTSVSVNSQTVCAGTASILTATPSAAGGTFSWTPGGQTTSSISVNPGSTTTYSVTYTLAGCSGINSGTVTVNTLPTVTVNSPTICIGQSASLTANGATSYSWNTGSSLNPLTVSPTINTSFTVTGTTNGCTNSAVSNVVVNSSPTVTVNSPTICSGETVTLTANGASTYTWSTGSTANPLITSPLINTNYTVMGTTAGCTNTAVSSVVVNSSPTITVNSPTICSGQTVTLTVNGATTYTWNTGSSANPLTASPTSNTNYSVTGTANGCTNTAVSSVVVNSNPTVTVNSPTICSGQTATLTANGATTYLWNTGSSSNPLSVSPTSNTSFTVTGATNGCTNTAVSNVVVNSTPTITVNSATICSGQTATLTANGATTYTWNTGSSINPLTVSPTTNTNFSVTGSVNGCTNSAVSNVVVNSNPTITVNPPGICAGASATLTASGATSYNWNTGATTNTIVVTPVSTTNFTVLGISLGCTNTAVANVSVTPLPTVTVNSPTICSGETATITANGATSYLWNTGSSSNPLTVSPISNTSFTLTGATNGCTNMAVSNVVVNSTPIITVNSATICSGQTATLTANGATSYTWNTGATTNSITDSPTVTTTYSVTGDLFGCTSTATTNITISSNLSLPVNSPTICAGQTATLTASGATTYTWSNGSTGSSIAVSPINTTTFAVIGANGSCTGTTVATVIVNALPTVTVNSPTICAGQTTTITANGASSYTWNTSSTANPLLISPASNTNYTVTGISNGCTNTAVSNVTVTSLPIVSINSPTICAGQTATLTANGAISYTWNTGSSANPLLVSPATNTSYTVTGTSNSCANTAVSMLSVTSLPTITFNTSAICIGQTATVIASGASSYTWSTGSSINSLTVSPTANTNYTVTGTTNACSNTAVVTVTVNPTPTLSINSPTICSGQTATITAGGATAYTWNTGATGNTFTVSPLSLTSYTVSGTLSGCTSNTVTQVQVVASPSLTVNPISLCAGTSGTLIANGASTYVWSNGSTTNTIAVSPLVNTTYSVVGSLGTCSASTTANVIVNALPILSISDKTICAGQNATLTANGATTYTWNTGSISNPLIVSPAATTIYSVTGSNFGCLGSATVSVTVNTAPSVLFNANKFSGCAPLCVRFSDLSSVSGSDNIIAWSWTFNDGQMSNEENPLHCFADSGLYNIDLTILSSNGCSASGTYTNMINVFPSPTAEFTVTPAETDILNSTIEFTNISSMADSYSWNFGDLTTSDQSDPTHTYNLAGIYSATLTATNQNGCEDIMIHDIIIKGIFTFYAPNTFTPNDDDVNDVFIPIGVGWDKDKYQFDIFDRWGKNCFTTKETDMGWDGKANKGSETAQIGAYTWKVELSDIFGAKHKYIGKVMIIK